MDSCKNLEKTSISIQLKFCENHSSYIFHRTCRNIFTACRNTSECIRTTKNISVVQSAFFRFSCIHDRISTAHSFLDYKLEKESIRFFTFRTAVFQTNNPVDQLHASEK